MSFGGVIATGGRGGGKIARFAFGGLSGGAVGVPVFPEIRQHECLLIPEVPVFRGQPRQAFLSPASTSSLISRALSSAFLTS